MTIQRIDGKMTPQRACELACEVGETVICIAIAPDGESALFSGGAPGTDMSRATTVGYLEWAKLDIMGLTEE